MSFPFFELHYELDLIELPKLDKKPYDSNRYRILLTKYAEGTAKTLYREIVITGYDLREGYIATLSEFITTELINSFGILMKELDKNWDQIKPNHSTRRAKWSEPGGWQEI